jgi:hypothetical protein
MTRSPSPFLLLRSSPASSAIPVHLVRIYHMYYARPTSCGYKWVERGRTEKVERAESCHRNVYFYRASLPPLDTHHEARLLSNIIHLDELPEATSHRLFRGLGHSPSHIRCRFNSRQSLHTALPVLTQLRRRSSSIKRSLFQLFRLSQDF